MGSDLELTVTVDTASTCIHLVHADQSVLLASTNELVTWLKANKATALGTPRDRLIDKFKRGTLFKWN
jgi:hypothetical protein